MCNQMKTKSITTWTIILITSILRKIECFEFMIGDCPVLYEEKCNSEAVKFYLSTSQPNGTTYHKLDPFKLKLPDNFNILTPLKIVIHGYGGLSLDIATRNVTKAYQEVGYNVIIVDWGALSSLPCYATAYLNTWHVGQCIAILAVSLIPLGIPPNFIHLVGFSLGAHVAGFAGANIRSSLKTTFQRITGLDPALPFFATFNNDWKLDLSDAKFVDVIHTSAGSFGKIEPSGHVDFYVNGGIIQPFCRDRPSPPLCSHVISGIYFAESIRNSDGSFIGRECDSFVHYNLGLCRRNRKTVMGENVNYNTKGTFFVETATNPPFFIN